MIENDNSKSYEQMKCIIWRNSEGFLKGNSFITTGGIFPG